MKNLSNKISLFIIITFIGCGPVVKTTVLEKHAKTPNTNEVYVISLNQSFPGERKPIGKIKITDSGFTIDCSYDAVIEKAKKEALKIGGNIVKLTELKSPNFSTSCYRIKADIFFVESIDALKKQLNTDTVSNVKVSDSVKNEYAIIHIFRPKNFQGSAITYDVHVGDTIVRKIRNNSKFSIKYYKEGNVDVWAKTESRASVTINIKMGEEYYLKCGIRTGMWVGIPEINFLEKSQGRSEYLNMKSK